MSGKNIGMIFGVIFIILGLLGFVNGAGIVGDGLFQTDTTHDVIHLITGLILLFVAMKSVDSIGMTLKVLGIIYLLVAILGFIGDGNVLSLFVVNTADNVLHLVIAIIFLWAGFAGSKNGGMMGSGM